MSLEKLETAQRELIELYLRLDLPKHWGDGKTVAADGTQYDFYDNNLLAGYRPLTKIRSNCDHKP